jgi:hypothetical protein
MDIIDLLTNDFIDRCHWVSVDGESTHREVTAWFNKRTDGFFEIHYFVLTDVHSKTCPFECSV